jgi:hypothetical protein
MTPLLLLAAFLAIVVAGGTLVFVYDAVEAGLSDLRDRRAVRTRRPGRPPGATTAVVAWRHLH